MAEGIGIIVALSFVALKKQFYLIMYLIFSHTSFPAGCHFTLYKHKLVSRASGQMHDGSNS
jgi:hypothetical protein